MGIGKLLNGLALVLSTPLIASGLATPVSLVHYESTMPAPKYSGKTFKNEFNHDIPEVLNREDLRKNYNNMIKVHLAATGILTFAAYSWALRRRED